MNEEFGDNFQFQGTGPPSDAQIAIAKQIENSIPNTTQPAQVALYLLRVARGDFGDALRPFTRAWPKSAPANPLILDFFKRTHTKPEGDQTSWCAAFVNWCIYRANPKGFPRNSRGSTSNAASGSFRDWGDRSAIFDKNDGRFKGDLQPQFGHIAVFQEIQNDGTPHPWKGHVAFFVSEHTGMIRVLGGNQFEGKPVIHAINVKDLRADGKLRLHSVRSDPCLGVT